MKRLISANTSEMLAMNAEELKQSIKARMISTKYYVRSRMTM